MVLRMTGISCILAAVQLAVQAWLFRKLLRCLRKAGLPMAIWASGKMNILKSCNKSLRSFMRMEQLQEYNWRMQEEKQATTCHGKAANLFPWGMVGGKQFHQVL